MFVRHYGVGEARLGRVQGGLRRRPAPEGQLPSGHGESEAKQDTRDAGGASDEALQREEGNSAVRCSSGARMRRCAKHVFWIL